MSDPGLLCVQGLTGRVVAVNVFLWNVFNTTPPNGWSCLRPSAILLLRDLDVLEGTRMMLRARRFGEVADKKFHVSVNQWHYYGTQVRLCSWLDLFGSVTFGRSFRVLLLKYSHHFP